MAYELEAENRIEEFPILTVVQLDLHLGSRHMTYHRATDKLIDRQTDRQNDGQRDKNATSEFSANFKVTRPKN